MKRAKTQQRTNQVPQAAFFWLTAFYFVYCARPQDYIHPLDYLALAKITSLFAFLTLLLSLGKTPRTLKDLPKESWYLFALIVLLFFSALLSPVWKGGAFWQTLDFAKVFVIWVLTFLLVTTGEKLRRIVFVQTASVAVIALVAMVKGHAVPRLFGVIGGIYSNPNDMAFAIVVSLPFSLAFLLNARSVFRKAAWFCAIAIMAVALFFTASRAGFIQLVVAGTICIWHFGFRRKRPILVLASFVLGILLLALAGKPLMKRFTAIGGQDISSQGEADAYNSYVERRELIGRALDAVADYPILGVGVGNFVTYSGLWKEVHVSYLQIAAEGGIPVFVLYLMFFARGFSNLSRLGRSAVLNAEEDALVGASRASLAGFAVGACFAPEAYQFFPYLAVCYTSVLVAMVKEKQDVPIPEISRLDWRKRFRSGDYVTSARRSRALRVAR